MRTPLSEGHRRPIVLVGSEAAGDVDAVKQSTTGRQLGECSRRRVAVRVDPERGALVQEEEIKDERLEHRNATPTTSRSVMPSSSGGRSIPSVAGFARLARD